MSRSGYTHDYDSEGTDALWRGAVARSISGRRGQAFLREMLSALDAMPIKILIAGDIVRDEEHVCGIGAVALSRKLDVSTLEPTDSVAVAEAFAIAHAMACEIAFMNDEVVEEETPEARWVRMRAWVAGNIEVTPDDVVA